MGFHVVARLPNLGLVSMAGNRDATECDVGVVDLVLARDAPFDALGRLLDQFEPHLVGLTAMSFQFPTAAAVGRWIKGRAPHVKVALGGYHATLVDPAELEGEEWCDFIVRGEGEVALRELVRATRRKASFADVPNLSWRGPDGRMRHNPRGPNLDLDELKPPDRDARLLGGYHMLGEPADVVETSRGCTHACKFCSIRGMYGRGIRYYSLDRVVADLRDCADRGARGVLFIDDNVTLNPERFEELCDRIVAEGLDDLSYHVQASATGLLARDSLVPKMGRAGFKVVFFGIESPDPAALKFFGKSVPVGGLRHLVRVLHDNGMISFGGFILGNPDDDARAFDRAVEFARWLDLDVPAFELLQPYPGTELRKELADRGLLVNPDDYSKYNGLFANARTRHLAPDALEREVLRCYYRYYSPRFLLGRLRQLGKVRRYWRFTWRIVRRYGGLALRSWLRGRSTGHGALDAFQRLRDSFRLRYRVTGPGGWAGRRDGPPGQRTAWLRTTTTRPPNAKTGASNSGMSGQKP